MRFFEKGTIKNGYGDNSGIILNDEDSHGIFSISVDNNIVTFCEECDGYYSRECSKEDAIKIMEEALTWLREA